MFVLHREKRHDLSAGILADLNKKHQHPRNICTEQINTHLSQLRRFVLVMVHNVSANTKQRRKMNPLLTTARKVKKAYPTALKRQLLSAGMTLLTTMPSMPQLHQQPGKERECNENNHPEPKKKKKSNISFSRRNETDSNSQETKNHHPTPSRIG